MVAAVAFSCEVNLLSSLFKNEGYFCYYLQDLM